MSDQMLKLEDVRVAIQGADVLRGVSLAVPNGGLVALVGRNGAGKTTTLRSVMGLIALMGGKISVDGVDLAQTPAFRRALLGIGYMPEDRRLIGRLTVADNLLLPAWSGGAANAPRRLDYVYGLMPDLAALASRRAAQLSGGQQKMAALARALMSATKLLLLDEPFEGLSPGLGDKLAATIREVQRTGISVLVAESDVKRVGFVQQSYTIERGEIVQESLPPDPRAVSGSSRGSEMSTIGRVAVVALLAGLLIAAGPAVGEKKYGPGVTDTEIKIGQTMPYSGPVSAYGTYGKAQVAFFRMVNEHGGINGRKITLLSLDDGYSPPRTVEQIRKLVEQEQVLMIFSSFGTPTNTAIVKYLNAKKVPQLFVTSGAAEFADAEDLPVDHGLARQLRVGGQGLRQVRAASAPEREDRGAVPARRCRQGLYARACARGSASALLR